jgi:hypothetical protein
MTLGLGQFPANLPAVPSPATMPPQDMLLAQARLAADGAKIRAFEGTGRKMPVSRVFRRNSWLMVDTERPSAAAMA